MKLRNHKKPLEIQEAIKKFDSHYFVPNLCFTTVRKDSIYLDYLT